MQHKIPRGARPLTLLMLAALAACNGGGDSGSSGYNAEIRRTSMGVPHIKAEDWGGAGFGLGYAQAQDNLCTLADAFLTYRGERSKYLGGDALAVNDSTIDRPRNIDSDFFHRHLLTTEKLDALRAAQTDSARALVDGFAAGYNRYVRELKSSANAHAACRDQPWVQPVTTTDVWRRMYQTNLAGGYSNFLPGIANALPPAAVAATMASAQTPKVAALTAADIPTPRMQVGGDRGIGSNMYGFGTTGTGSDSPVLFGNPHWYWTGPDRFYQAQLTIPGVLDVSGVSFLGVPIIQIGFNQNVAWSHTVSTARRFRLLRAEAGLWRPDQLSARRPAGQDDGHADHGGGQAGLRRGHAGHAHAVQDRAGAVDQPGAAEPATGLEPDHRVRDPRHQPGQLPHVPQLDALGGRPARSPSSSPSRSRRRRSPGSTPWPWAVAPPRPGMPKSAPCRMSRPSRSPPAPRPSAC